ncbi:hypothetical protein [Micromonospora endophytica]|uniref:hypothetical protein n=1 Tax=Micromonospora endophytica TaxID=515350 RepID=UPI001CB9272C|nr:hypothetical protein [Micromonospora endophytica]
MQRLVTATDDTTHSPLGAAPDQTRVHEQADKDLGFLDRHGALTRDLRGVLIHHVLFLFNRLGISATDTWLLATAAVHVTFHHSSDIPPGYQPAETLRVTEADCEGRHTPPGDDTRAPVHI